MAVFLSTIVLAIHCRMNEIHFWLPLTSIIDKKLRNFSKYYENILKSLCSAEKRKSYTLTKINGFIIVYSIVTIYLFIYFGVAY